jgi:endogenous inhibitor of DNA gyrase (YacG/DUF329 family)
MSASLPDARKCGICGKPQNPAYRPFCSRRCADIDLGRWLKGGYAIPARPEDESGNATPDPDPPSNDD